MWRRVASQSPMAASGPNSEYIKAFTALGQMLRDGRSLSGHERNCCFLNTHDDHFATVSAASGLNFTDDGRAIGLTDWDHDGDVDVWLYNRTGPRLRFMRNNSNAAAQFVSVRLTGTKCNRDAIGARLELHLENEPEGVSSALIRTVHAGRGFLSQASKRVHFGVGVAKAKQLVVRWPDGDVQRFGDIQVGQHYEITQGSERATIWTRPTKCIDLTPSLLDAPPLAGTSRVVISGRLPMPGIQFSSIQTDQESVANRPTLINVWATNCLPCVAELAEYSRSESRIRQAGLNILALNVDELLDVQASDLAKSRQIIHETAFPFAAAAIDAEQSGMLDLFHQAFLSLRRPLPVPSSFLTTADGRIAVIYRGPTSPGQVLRDLDLLDDDLETLRNRAAPFPGRWHAKPNRPNPARHATAFLRGGFLDAGATYLETYLQRHLNRQGWGPREEWPTATRLAELCDVLANYYRLRNEPKKVFGVYQIALQFDPTFVPSLMNLGKILIGQRNIREGIGMLEQAHRLAPADTMVASDLAIGYAMTGRDASAEQIFLSLLKRDPESADANLNLGRLYFQSSRYADAKARLTNHLKVDPYSVEAIKSIGWILACSPDEVERNPLMADTMLKRLTSVIKMETAESHDLRAAIHAAVGDFERAIAEVSLAIQVARDQENVAFVVDAEKRLALYREAKPFRLK